MAIIKIEPTHRNPGSWKGRPLPCVGRARLATPAEGENDGWPGSGSYFTDCEKLEPPRHDGACSFEPVAAGGVECWFGLRRLRSCMWRLRVRSTGRVVGGGWRCTRGVRRSIRRWCGRLSMLGVGRRGVAGAAQGWDRISSRQRRGGRMQAGAGGRWRSWC